MRRESAKECGRGEHQGQTWIVGRDGDKEREDKEYTYKEIDGARCDAAHHEVLRCRAPICGVRHPSVLTKTIWVTQRA